MSGTSSSQSTTAKPICLKALVDKEKNRVVFVESNKDFAHVLFSFLTMPLGTMIRLTRNDQPPTIAIGCMNNIYASVENLHAMGLLTDNCKKMLLYPKIFAAAHCRSIDDGQHSHNCFGCKYISYHSRRRNQVNYGEGFVEEHARFLVTDKLQVMPSSTAASVSIITKLGITYHSVVEERTFHIGATEVLKLLKCSLASEAPLTEILLQHKPKEQILLQHKPKEEQISKEDLEGRTGKCQTEEHVSKGTEKISIRLLLIKSKQMVCYAEAGKDFVDLLLSFLTIPLGCMAKEMKYGHSCGSINHLYKSVQDLDAAGCLKFDDTSPTIAPGFGYGNQLLGSQGSSTAYGIPVVDPRSNESGGFVLKPGKFMVTDNLIITPFSSLSAWSTLKKLKVPLSEIEERAVVVGNKSEAWRLFVACFTSESALTDTFIREESKKSIHLQSSRRILRESMFP